MSLQVTTGSSTKIYVANLKTFSEIQVAQSFDATDSVNINFVSAIGKKRPVYSYSEINDNPVSGNLNVLKANSFEFMKIAMGLDDTDTFNGFTTIDSKTVYFLIRYFDNNTDTEFASAWVPMAKVSSNKEDVPLKGVLTTQFTVNAGMVLSLPNKATIEKLPVASGSATLSNAPVLYNGKEFFYAGVDANGDYEYFVVDTDNGEIIPESDWSVSGTTLTVPTTVNNVMVAYQYV